VIDLVSLSEKDILRLDSTAKFLAGVGVPVEIDISAAEAQGGYFDSVCEAYTAATSRRIIKELLVARAPNFTSKVFDYTENDEGRTYIFSALALIPAAYGAIHISVLQLTFPSVVERLLWKISCYILTMPAVACGIICLFVYLIHHFNWKWVMDMWRILGSLVNDSIREYTILPTYCIVLIAYIGSRLYLVVESFVSLRHVPVGVYETPSINFMNYVPHL
jgi:hypothetical protein